ncbi:MAG TPA: transposase [Bacillota bacterium]|nr:transposase [Bacillota bacterium]
MKKTKARKQAPVNKNQSVTKKYEAIKLGLDWHACQYRVVRIIDGAGPEPAQRFSPEDFFKWVEKQLALAKKVYACYEAGAGGFVVYRRLTKLGATAYVVAPRKLDPRHKGVCNDATDARELAQNLSLYVGGNPKAMQVVYVPTEEEEQRRAQSRQRQQLAKDRLSLASRGRCLLLSQGHRESNHWWKPTRWAKLSPALPAWLVESLAITRRLILEVDKELQSLTQKVSQAAAQTPRPVGLGALTLEALNREVCSWKRFANRKQPGSYAGLTGGVSASGNYQCDLSITKAGNARLRALLIELAWRMVYYQPQCTLVQRWATVMLNPKAHARARKKAIVAMARQLFVDLWRWQTGRVTPEQLGWKMWEPAQAKA